MQCVGFDPGGKNAFGWCIVSFDGSSVTCEGGVVSDACGALDAAQAVLEGPPAAVGIDAPLFWVNDDDRDADRAVRALVRAAGGHNGTVGHVNSLRGACLVQGVLVARKAAECWAGAAITEAHPKALRQVCAKARVFADRPELVGVGHLRDAALAAFAAHALATDAAGWHDLVKREREPFFPSGAPVRYWFPVQLLA
jgi:hypothetical protein